MFAIAFDMDIKELRTTYGEPYNNAYYEIKILLRKYDFYNTQGSVYLTDKDDMAICCHLRLEENCMVQGFST